MKKIWAPRPIREMFLFPEKKLTTILGTVQEMKIRSMRELAKQGIHGGMKVGICPDGKDQAGISYDSNDVDEEDNRDKEISMSPSWEKAQENEICAQCLVSCLHVVSLPASPERKRRLLNTCVNEKGIKPET